MNYPLIFVIGILVEILLKLISTNLNKKNLYTVIQKKKFNKDLFEEEYLKKSYNYLSDKIPIEFTSEIFSVCFILYLVFSNNIVNLSLLLNLKFNNSPIISHLLLLGIIGLIYFIFTLPLNIYDTFYIEKKYGFSTITVKTYILDIIKSIIVSIILGGLLLSIIFYIVIKFKTMWWIYAWLVSIMYSLFIIKIFPTLISPLFNKFTPLEEGELKSKILYYADKSNFKIKNILKSDASKRTKHSNAYFTGLGNNKQIVLYDNLIEKLKIDELVSVILHEIAHYKKKHIWVMLIIQSFITGLILFLVKELIYIDDFIMPFNLTNTHYLTKFILSVIFIQSFIWLLGIPAVFLSRKNEFEADEYSARVSQNPADLKNSLIKLVKDNLSNPYPHPLYSSLYYSHPPVTERITKLNNQTIKV